MRGRRVRRADVLRGGAVLSLMAAGLGVASAQNVRGAGEMPLPGLSTVQPQAPATPGVNTQPGLDLLPPQGPAYVIQGPNGPVAPEARILNPNDPVGPQLSNRLEAPRVARTTYIEGVIDVRGTGTDRGRLDVPSGKDIILGVSPRLSFHTRGARLQLDATVGLDAVDYVKNTNDDFFQPLVAGNLSAELVENLVFLDASGSLDRRSASPYTTQGSDAPTSEQVETGILRVTPRLERHLPSGWNTLLRSENIWTKRGGDGVDIGGQYDDSYSQNTEFRFDRTPQRFGAGVEGGYELLKYKGTSENVIELANARLSAGFAITPQFTGWLLGGAERSKFGAGTETETDADYGMRVRWAPLERSVLTGEVRKRFFGTGFNAQWDHRHRNFGFTLSGSREPLTEPEAIQLSGNVGEQFDAIYRARGYTQAQRDALVRAALIAYGLPPNLTDPVSLRVNRAQLSTTANGILSLLGRRTAVVWSTYYRKLVALQRSDDPVVASAPGDVRQIGTQLSYNLMLTPLSTFDAFYRYDDARGLGFDLGRNTRDQVFSIGTTHSLSPRTRVNLSLQHHRLETAVPSQPTTSASANSATLGVTYRF